MSGGVSDGASEARDRAQEALSHLQAAARELIQAFRVALDVAEDVVGHSLKVLGEDSRPAPATPPPVERIEVVRADPGEP